MSVLEAAKNVTQQLLERPRILVKKIDPLARLPERGSAEAAGYDLFSAGDWELPTGVVVAIATGLAIEIPAGHVGLISDRSGLASKGITTKAIRVNKAASDYWHGCLNEATSYMQHPLGGVIDSDYRGEWRVLMINTATEPYAIKKGDKIAQFLVLKCSDYETVEVADFPISDTSVLTETARGTGGFGSTGR